MTVFKILFEHTVLQISEIEYELCPGLKKPSRTVWCYVLC